MSTTGNGSPFRGGTRIISVLFKSRIIVQRLRIVCIKKLYLICFFIFFCFFVFLFFLRKTAFLLY